MPLHCYSSCLTCTAHRTAPLFVLYCLPQSPCTAQAPWLHLVDTVFVLPHCVLQAPWLYMIETDFVFIKPLVPPRAESGDKSVAFPYGYIQPTYPTIEVRAPGWRQPGGCWGCRGGWLGGWMGVNAHLPACNTCTTPCTACLYCLPVLPACTVPQGVMRKLYPAELGPLTDVPPTGPSPTLLRVEEWMRVTPRWEELTAKVGGCVGAWVLMLAGWICAVPTPGCFGSAACSPALLRVPFTCPSLLNSPSCVLPPPSCPPPAPACLQIEADEESKKALDWVREMYAFSVAAALEKIPLDLQVGLLPACCPMGCWVPGLLGAGCRCSHRRA